MKSVIPVYKEVGTTPLQVIQKLRTKYPEYTDVTLGYAGRLDPMAEGLLLILAGEENKKRKLYERLPKEYEFETIFGLRTDTYDVMGKFTAEPHSPSIDKVQEQLKKALPSFIGRHTQPYPPFSSARVNGKPLFYWAREGLLETIQIPEKQVEITSLRLLSLKKISAKNIAATAIERIRKVEGIFRQEEIITKWEAFLKTHHEIMYPLGVFNIVCSGGTYVRSIAEEMGAIAFRIMRISAGSFSLKDALYL